MRKYITSLSTVFTLIFILECTGCSIGYETWTDIGGVIRSNTINCLVYDEKEDLLYAGTEEHGVYQYDGSEWSQAGEGLSNTTVKSLAYNTKNNVLYAGTYWEGVWRYQGGEWANTGGAVSEGRVGSLAYDEVHDIFYAGVGSTVWQYDDTEWTNIGKIETFKFLGALVFAPKPDILYAGTVDNGVWKHESGTWTDLSIGKATPDQVLSLAYDSERDLLYVGTMKGPNASSGAWMYDGADWNYISGVAANFNILSLVYDPNHNILYAGTDGYGVWEYNCR